MEATGWSVEGTEGSVEDTGWSVEDTEGLVERTGGQPLAASR